MPNYITNDILSNILDSLKTHLYNYVQECAVFFISHNHFIFQSKYLFIMSKFCAKCTKGIHSTMRLHDLYVFDFLNAFQNKCVYTITFTANLVNIYYIICNVLSEYFDVECCLFLVIRVFFFHFYTGHRIFAKT